MYWSLIQKIKQFVWRTRQTNCPILCSIQQLHIERPNVWYIVRRCVWLGFGNLHFGLDSLCDRNLCFKTLGIECKTRILADHIGLGECERTLWCCVDLLNKIDQILNVTLVLCGCESGETTKSTRVAIVVFCIDKCCLRLLPINNIEWVRLWLIDQSQPYSFYVVNWEEPQTAFVYAEDNDGNPGTFGRLSTLATAENKGDIQDLIDLVEQINATSKSSFALPKSDVIGKNTGLTLNAKSFEAKVPVAKTVKAEVKVAEPKPYAPSYNVSYVRPFYM